MLYKQQEQDDGTLNFHTINSMLLVQFCHWWDPYHTPQWTVNMPTNQKHFFRVNFPCLRSHFTSIKPQHWRWFSSEVRVNRQLEIICRGIWLIRFSSWINWTLQGLNFVNIGFLVLSDCLIDSLQMISTNFSADVAEKIFQIVWR